MTAPSLPAVIAELERLLAKATKGPLSIEGMDTPNPKGETASYDEILLAPDGESIVADHMTTNNARLACALWNAAPALIAAGKRNLDKPAIDFANEATIAIFNCSVPVENIDPGSSEAAQFERTVDLCSRCFVAGRSVTLLAAAKEAEQLRKVLKEHHDWHMQAGAIGLPDGEGGWIEINNGDEYSDSAMYEHTTAALEGLPPDEAAPMPRGGVSAYWWQVAVLERRKRRALAKEAERMRYCRSEVLAFALLMERELRANDHKSGWKDDTPRSLAARVLEEADELAQVVAERVGLSDQFRGINTEQVSEEAADVANMAMMVADVCGALSPLPSPPEAGK